MQYSQKSKLKLTVSSVFKLYFISRNRPLVYNSGGIPVSVSSDASVGLEIFKILSLRFDLLSLIQVKNLDLSIFVNPCPVPGLLKVNSWYLFLRVALLEHSLHLVSVERSLVGWYAFHLQQR